MSSNDIDAWRRRWPNVAQRVQGNAGLARQLARAARVNAGRAQKALAEGDLDAAVIWAEFALLNAADAVLQSDGVRVRGKEGAHQARFDYPRLPKIFSTNAPLIDRARAQRNVAAYEGGGRISKKEATDVVTVCDRATSEVAKLFP